MGILVDGVEEYKGWKGDIESFVGVLVSFLIIVDIDLVVVKVFDMLFVDVYLFDGCILVDIVIVWFVFIILLDKKL